MLSYDFVQILFNLYLFKQVNFINFPRVRLKKIERRHRESKNRL